MKHVDQGSTTMDLNSLSLFMQTSLVYECSTCKLYFGTEDQLFNHHKQLHSKLLKVSLNPKLALEEDEDYNNTQVAETPNESNSSSINPDDHTDQLNVPKVEVSEEAPRNRCESNVQRSVKTELLENEASDDKDDFLSTSSLSDGNDQSGPAQGKRVHIESIRYSNENDEDACANNQWAAPHRIESMIEKAQYGYLVDAGFHPFTIEEVKKFAIQIVALFKLGETNHFASKSQAQTSNLGLPPCHTGAISSLTSVLSNPSSSQVALNVMRSTPVNNEVIMEENISDPTKSCYKCGEFGHFAWGCTNPRNRTINPTKRRRRGKKRKQPGGGQGPLENVAMTNKCS